jgi:hypothetical protein
MQTPTTETPSIEQLYEEQIRSLTPEQKLRMIALIAQGLAGEFPKRPSRSILGTQLATLWGRLRLCATTKHINFNRNPAKVTA